jgi:phosphoribosylformylglycinamidine cyclo-ligase
METSTKTEQNGVSASKDDVRNAVQSNGLFPKSFCKIVPDVFGDSTKQLFSKPYVNVMHTTGAEINITSKIEKNFEEANMWEGIAQIAIFQTLNDIICTGITNNILLSSRILIDHDSREDTTAIVQAVEKCLMHLRSKHINVFFGGNTTDYSDGIVRIDATAAARIRQGEIIANDRIQDKDVIIGLASLGQATYETGRHYGTRNYMPVVKAILENFRPSIHALVHCSDGQTKCLDFVDDMHIVKDNFFEISPVFEEIKEAAGVPWEDMYRLFNMGHGFEIFTKEKIADDIIKIAQYFGVDAQIIGRCEAAPNKALTINSKLGTFRY